MTSITATFFSFDPLYFCLEESRENIRVYMLKNTRAHQNRALQYTTVRVRFRFQYVAASFSSFSNPFVPGGLREGELGAVYGISDFRFPCKVAFGVVVDV